MCIFLWGLEQTCCVQNLVKDWSSITCLTELFARKDGPFRAVMTSFFLLPHFKVGLRLEVGQLLLNLAQKPCGCKTSFVL